MTSPASSKMRLAPALSFAGSTERLWRLTDHANPWVRYLLLVPAAAVLVLIAWAVVAVYYFVMYVFFGVLFLPWRILRRGNRKRKIEKARHEELLEAMRDRS